MCEETCVILASMNVEHSFTFFFSLSFYLFLDHEICTSARGKILFSLLSRPSSHVSHIFSHSLVISVHISSLSFSLQVYISVYFHSLSLSFLLSIITVDCCCFFTLVLLLFDFHLSFFLSFSLLLYLFLSSHLTSLTSLLTG